MTHAPLRIDDQHSGEAISCDASSIVFRTDKAYPPGQPVALSLWPDHATPLALAARSIGSKRMSDDRYEVRARLVNLSRHARQRLLDAFGRSSG
jgi:hypothetical protein